jgi:hypothetical protein
MKKRCIAALFVVCAVVSLIAQEIAGAPALPTISRQLYSFSPLGAIYVRGLSRGLEVPVEDKNGNGTIDKGAGEGDEEFVERYGIGATIEEKERSVDCGFAANGVIYGAGDGRLQEPEIVNHYYINIRFKEQEATEIIESEVSAYIHANNLPLVWLDDERGTVMNAVTHILGAGWNEQEVTEDEAVKMFNRTMQGLHIFGQTGSPFKTGHYSLPAFINRKRGYCFEVAQFGFWFFSQLKINSIPITGMLTSSTQHDIVKLIDSNKIVDYFNSSAGYHPKWDIMNPLQALGYYYRTLSKITTADTSSTALEYAITYNKYDITTTSFLVYSYYNTPNPDYEKIITLGEFILQNIDIDKIVNSTSLDAAKIKNNLKTILLIMQESYTATHNNSGITKIQQFISNL